MADFTKFDPRAFLERERQGDVTALAGLAGLAGGRVQSSNPPAVSDVVHQIPLQPILLQPEPQRRDTSAKVAKVAKATGPIWSDAEEERAAIVEYDAGAPRDWVEAWVQVHLANPPSELPRWGQFLEDCTRFVDQGWAERAEVIGWRALDLFGCDRERPFTQIDTAGLLWLINGGRIVSLSNETVTIESPTGTRQSYRRRPIEAGKIVIAWEPTS